jgi:hypothetical protein
MLKDGIPASWLTARMYRGRAKEAISLAFLQENIEKVLELQQLVQSFGDHLPDTL